MRISSKLGLITIGVSILTTLVVSLFTYTQLRDSLFQHELEWQRTVAQDMMKQINRTMAQAQRDLQLLAEDELLQNYLQAVDRTDSLELEIIRSQLAERLELTGPWLSLALLDSQGQKLIHLDHQGDLTHERIHQHLHSNGVGHDHEHFSWVHNSDAHSSIRHYPQSLIAFKAALAGEVYNSDYLMSDYLGEPTVIFATPVYCQKPCVLTKSLPKATGVIVAHLDWTAVEEQLKSNNPQLIAHLFNQQGQEIANHGEEADNHLQQDLSEIQAFLQKADHQAVQHHIHHSSGDTEQELAILVKQTANTNFVSHGWTLLLEQPLKSVFGELNKITFQASMLTAAALVFLAVVLALIAQIIISPLKYLSELTDRIGQGDYTAKLPIKRSDEIGHLSSNFNKMIDRLADRDAALTASENHLKNVINTVPNIFYTVQIPSNMVSFVSPAVQDILGYTPESCLGDALELFERVIHPDDLGLVQEFIEKAGQTGKGYTTEYRIRHIDGHYIWFEDRFDWEKDEQGNIIASQGILTNIQQRRALFDDLQQTTRALRAIHGADKLLLKADSLNEYLQGICHNLVHQDGYSFAWIGLLDKDEQQHINLVVSSGDNSKLLTKLQNDPLADCGSECAACKALRQQKTVAVNDLNSNQCADGANDRQSNGHSYQAQACLPVTYDAQELGVLCLFADEVNCFTAEEKEVLAALAESIAYGVYSLELKQQHQQAQERINYDAFHDGLTGLPNRNLLLSTLEQSIRAWNRSNESIAVLLIDLDEFKLVNDTLGHQTGDALLKEVASRIESIARQTDIVARQAGDEFIILMNGLSPQGNPINREDNQQEFLTPATLAQRIIDSFSAPFEIEGHTSYIGCSIGISVCPFDSENSLELLQFADAAMYRAKEVGRGCYQFYSQELTDKQQNRLSIATGLHSAIKNHEFVLHYQPVIELSSGKIVGVEALIRWQKASGELLAPNHFLDVAEDTGLIEQIGDWVLQEVCHQAKVWQQNNIDLHIAFNLSPRQFWQKDVASKMLKSIAESGLSAHALMVEITETAMSLDEKQVAETMAQFHDGGVYVYLDDFGTGYSSMSRLKSLPIHTLKIDQSFVAGLPTDENDLALVSATLNLAQSLGMETLAEGIETEAQYRWLQNNGCLYGQGYFFSKPLPVEELMELVASPPNWKESLKP